MKKGIKSKITRLVLAISLLALALMFILSIASILVIRNRSIETSAALGKNAAYESSSALAWQAQQALVSETYSLAVQAEQKTSIFSVFSLQVAEYITNILETNTADKEFSNQADAEGVYFKYFNSINNEVTPQAKKIANANFVMKNIVANYPSITSVYFAGEDKTFIVAEKLVERPVDFSSDMTDTQWYTAAKNAETTTFADVFKDEAGSIHCATPIYKDEVLVGVVGVSGLFKDVSVIINDAKLDHKGFAYVINDKRETIISDGKDISELAALTPINGDEMMLTRYNGKEVFLISFKMPLLNLTVGAVYDVSEVLKASYEMQSKMDKLSMEAKKLMNQTIMGAIFISFNIVILTVIAIVSIGKAFALKLINPILELSKGIDSIDEKNIKYKNCIKTGDEIEKLGESFERMTMQVSSYMDNLVAIAADEQRIGAQLEIASQIQLGMLPCAFPPFPDKKELDIFAVMRPSEDVGGDIYDFFLVDDNHLAVIVADVSGRGAPATLFMLKAKTLIKNYAQMGKSTSEIFTETNTQLCEGNETGLFVTAWLAILEISSGKLSYTNAGHYSPLIKLKDGKFEYLHAKPDFVLAGMNCTKYGQLEITLNKGDKLFLYTDGVTNAIDSKNELLGKQRLINCLNNSVDENAKTLISNVEIEIEQFVAGEKQIDDITMLCLQINK